MDSLQRSEANSNIPVAWTSENELAGLGLMHGDIWEQPKNKDDIPLYRNPFSRVPADNSLHRLTGADVMHYRKIPLVDRLVIWGSAIGIIVIAVIGLLRGAA
ncbi:hypothetical protein EKN56_04635 [Limnobaculum zhutongyuii]|uniref:Uncharacterized protein n=1 Tax=Limnobaculum zhutongyuii TaxID=2498113 RepID=A0A411WHL8_9GAMM|nr:hypothetical protein [Limnobaculum zhutongyuii]QBH95748.1 hypothetical protein EKN56_04635 [Limnobaculum zhutongyuii]TQS86131.1 hypothetical protein ELQ32_20295 [Limnobaculum zhutongyuii]